MLAPLHRLVLERAEAGVRGLSFAPNGGLVAAGSTDGVVLIDTRTGTPQQTFRAPIGNVWAVAFAPDGRHLAACGDEGACAVWMSGGRTVRVLRPQPASGDQLAVAFSGDSRRIAFAGADGVVREWKLGAPEPHVVGQPGSPVIALAWVRSHGETALAAAASTVSSTCCRPASRSSGSTPM